jgi:taurine dioxygenase
MRGRESISPIGADVFDIDLSLPVAQSAFDEIVEVFYQRAVIAFREQTPTADQQIAFSRRFGDLDVNVRSEFNKDGRPEILVFSNIQKDGKPIGGVDAGRYWLTDLCYLKRPARATLLHATEVPMNGTEPLGDTLFSSMTAAYDALSDAMKTRIAGLTTVHNYRYKHEQKAQDFKLRPQLAERGSDWISPDVVRAHPYAGRKYLYVNEGCTTRIVNLSTDESKDLLEELKTHATGNACGRRNGVKLPDGLHTLQALQDRAARSHHHADAEPAADESNTLRAARRAVADFLRRAGRSRVRCRDPHGSGRGLFRRRRYSDDAKAH